MTRLPAISPTALSAPAAIDRAALCEAAQGFEAIFVRRMLAAARGDTRGHDPFAEMRDSALADIAAARGAFGLASALEAQLARSSGKVGS